MRLLSLGVLWLNFALLVGFWFWGESVYRDAKHEFFRATCTFRYDTETRSAATLSDTARRAEAIAKYESTSAHETGTYRLWRDSCLLLFVWTLCSLVWVTLSRTDHRWARSAMKASMGAAAIGGAVAVLTLRGIDIIGQSDARSYPGMQWLNLAVVGGIIGAVFGAVPGLIAGLLPTRTPNRPAPTVR